jgi:hypothetical protein
MQGVHAYQGAAWNPKTLVRCNDGNKEHCLKHMHSALLRYLSYNVTQQLKLLFLSRIRSQKGPSAVVQRERVISESRAGNILRSLQQRASSTTKWHQRDMGRSIGQP